MAHLDSAQAHRETVERVQELREMVGPFLEPTLKELLQRHGFHNPDLLHPLGHPVVELPLWVAAAVETPDSDRELVSDLVEATVIGYLYVRAQDDFLDESIGEAGEVMMLADALLARHVALVAGAAGSSPRFWALFQRKAWAYANAMLLERELLQRNAEYGASEFEQVLQRSDPLAIPAAVILDRADRWDRLDGLEQFVRHVTRAGQLVDDLRDAVRDLDRGNYSWVVRLMDGLQGRDVMVARLAYHGGFDEIMGKVEADLDRAAQVAHQIGLSQSLPWLSARRQAAKDLTETFYRALFEAL